jgi:hypothetical protein
VFRPDGNGGRVEVVVLGRGQFVGERAVINDKLRSADCVAQGQVQVRCAGLGAVRTTALRATSWPEGRVARGGLAPCPGAARSTLGCGCRGQLAPSGAKRSGTRLRLDQHVRKNSC